MKLEPAVNTNNNLGTKLWTLEMDAKLKELWGNGLSASEVATHFPGKTRAAILGRINRLGLHDRVMHSKKREEYARSIGTPYAYTAKKTST